MKNNKIVKLFLLISHFFFCNISLSQQNQTAQVSKSATVFYINGVGKFSESVVRSDVRAIQDGLNKFCSKYQGDVQLLFNPSYASSNDDRSGAVQDIIFDFSRQKIAESFTPFAVSVLNATLFVYGLTNDLSVNDRNNIENRFASDINRSFLSDQSLRERDVFAAAVNASISRSRSALIISHSQGNLYANGVYEDIRASGNKFFQNGLHVVGVAVPASSTPDGNYVTLNEDLIILGLRTFTESPLFSNTFRPPLPSNASLFGSQTVDKTGHNFADVYMSNKLPLDVAPDSRSTALGRIITRNVNLGFRQIYRPVDENGLPGVADSTSNSPCDR